MSKKKAQSTAARRRRATINLARIMPSIGAAPVMGAQSVEAVSMRPMAEGYDVKTGNRRRVHEQSLSLPL
jgi:hypothetical protein